MFFWIISGLISLSSYLHEKYDYIIHRYINKYKQILTFKIYLLSDLQPMQFATINKYNGKRGL